MELVLPEEVTYIGDCAFCATSLSKLKNGVFTKGVKYVGDFALPKNIKMDVDLEGIEHIGQSGFAGSKYTIKSTALPNSLKYIGPAAFRGNTSLSGELVIPDSVTYVGEQALQR